MEMVVVVGGVLQMIKSYNVFGLRHEGIWNHQNLMSNIALAFGSRHVMEPFVMKSFHV